MPTTHRFQNLSPLCPDISNEHCATVSSERVLENVGQLGLSVGDVATPLVSQGSYHLLEEGERLVDVERFTLNIACGLGIEMSQQNLNNLVKMYIPQLIEYNARSNLTQEISILITFIYGAIDDLYQKSVFSKIEITCNFFYLLYQIKYGIHEQSISKALVRRRAAFQISFGGGRGGGFQGDQNGLSRHTKNLRDYLCLPPSPSPLSLDQNAPHRVF